MTEFAIDVTVARGDDLVSCDLDGDTAVLHLKCGIYYTLNPVATTVWTLIEEPRRVGDVHTSLLERYAIDADTCASDLQSFLQDLFAHGLLMVRT